MLEKLKAQLKHSEGLRLQAYLDTKGILTIGYGHNLMAKPIPNIAKVGDSISQYQAELIFEEDVKEAIANVDKTKELAWVKDMPDPARQAVIYDMAFNMGTKTLLTFKNTLAMVKAQRYQDAAQNMLKSKWAGQVGNRAVRLSRQMETGIWQ